MSEQNKASPAALTVDSVWQRMDDHAQRRTSLENIADVLNVLAAQPAADARADKLLLPMPELIDRDGCMLELRFEEESQAEEFQRGLSLPAPAGKAFPENVEFADPAPVGEPVVANDVQEAFMRLCEALGIPATAGAYLEVPRLLATTAPVASPAALTDAQILALNHGERYFSESPSKYPEAGHGTQYHCGVPGLLGLARALLATQPAVDAPKGAL